MNNNRKKIGYGIIFLFSVFLMYCNDSSSNPDKNEKTLELIGKRQISIQEPSGLVYDSQNDLLRTVSDQTGLIYLLATNGDLVRVLEYEGNDPEAITLDPNSNNMYVSMEEQREIVKLDSTGHFLSYFSVPNYHFPDNKGVEGLTYHPDSDHLFFIYEKSPSILVESDTVGNVISTIQMNFAEDYSGMTYYPQKGTLLICSDDSEALYEYKVGEGLIGAWSLDIKQVEGITVKDDTLFAVSDSEEELYIYKMEN